MPPLYASPLLALCGFILIQVFCVVSRVTLFGPRNPRVKRVTFSYPVSICHIQWRNSNLRMCILLTRGQEDTERKQSNSHSMQCGRGNFSMERRLCPDTFHLLAAQHMHTLVHTLILFFHMYNFFCTLPNVIQPTYVYPFMYLSLLQSKRTPSALQLDHTNSGALSNMHCSLSSLDVAFHRPAIYI